MLLGKLDLRKRTELVLWGVLNILLPLLPILVKATISLASQIFVPVINNVELLYYNLMLCLLNANLLKKSNSCAGVIFSVVVLIIGVVDIVLIVISYLHLGTVNISKYSIVVAIVMPIAFIILKLVMTLSDKDGVDYEH